MKKFREISEKAGDTAVFTFGRFNPPTIGHEKLVNAVAKQQSKNSGSKMYVYASHSTDPKKNPLPYAKKIAYMRKMFKKYSRNIIIGKPRTAIEVAVELYNKGHRAIVLVVGSDRVTEFRKLLEEYNGVEGKRHGYYGFDNIEVVSAGERDPDAEGVEGMSASKMRVAAEKGDFDSFKTGIPDSMSDADKKKMYLDVRKGMGMREEREMGDDYDSLRDAYLTGKIWNVGESVETEHGTGEIVRKGTNYLSYMVEDGKVHKAWLHDIAERNYKKEYANYQGTPEQIARRSSRNKARRAMGDKVVKGMDVGHKDNNPMNNDPKNLRMEKPSDNRREPRLREEDEFNETPISDLIGKIDAITHPKKYKSAMKKYASLMAKDRSKRMTTGALAQNAAREYNIDVKSLITYINTLVAKGKLPKALKAEYQKEDTMHTFSDLVKKINEVKQDKDVKDKEGTQPAKYYAGDMAKSTKDKRDAHFKAKKTGPAPGDASAETKPSKHTKKFKQMYGEKLGKDADAGDYIDDFEKSDAPQFKGKSKEKRKDMAIAAYLSKNESLLDKVNQMLSMLSEDGHTDVISMKNKVQVAMAALQKMNGELSKLGDEDDLPTWWTNKVATAVSRLDDMSDYLDTQVEEVQLEGKMQDVWQKKNAKSLSVGPFELIRGKGGVSTIKRSGKVIGDFSYDDEADNFVANIKGERAQFVGDDIDSLFTHLQKVHSEEVELDEKIAALVKKAEKSGMPYSILKKVYDRGMAAYKTGHRPGATPQQWALARVNSFTTKSSGTWGKADKDLAQQVEQLEELDEKGPGLWANIHKKRKEGRPMRKKGEKGAPTPAQLKRAQGEEAELNEWGEIEEQAEYQGRKVTLNKPTKGDVKKSKVYVRNEKGNVVKVEFGDPNMQIQKDIPARRKSFRARHNCDNPGPKWKARYWSCKAW